MQITCKINKDIYIFDEWKYDEIYGYERWYRKLLSINGIIDYTSLFGPYANNHCMEVIYSIGRKFVSFRGNCSLGVGGIYGVMEDLKYKMYPSYPMTDIADFEKGKDLCDFFLRSINLIAFI